MTITSIVNITVGQTCCQHSIQNGQKEFHQQAWRQSGATTRYKEEVEEIW